MSHIRRLLGNITVVQKNTPDLSSQFRTGFSNRALSTLLLENSRG